VKRYTVINRNVTENFNRNFNNYGNFWHALSSVVKRITTFKWRNLYRFSRDNKIEFGKSYTHRNYANSIAKLSLKRFDRKHAQNRHKLWKVSESQKRILETTGEAQSPHRNLGKLLTFDDHCHSLIFQPIISRGSPSNGSWGCVRLCLLQCNVVKQRHGSFFEILISAQHILCKSTPVYLILPNDCHSRMLDIWVILVCNTLFPMTINMLYKHFHLLVYDQTFHVAERIRARASLEIYWRPPEEACSRLRSIVLNKY